MNEGNNFKSLVYADRPSSCVLFTFVEQPGLSAIFAGLQLIFAGELQKDKNQSFYEGLQMKNKQGNPVTSVYTVS